MIKARTVAAWILAVAIGAAPSAGFGQEMKAVKPIIPNEIKEVLPNVSESEKEKEKQREQSLPEPIMDEQRERISKEIPS
ncbi:MAG: hypothetical protein HY788_24160 [Deltaproteobacteria bacterium]|nr:hypothetical protein [Deltaproteobacteria bacterium]